MVAVASGLMKSKQEVDRARIDALERTRELEQEIVRVSEREQRRIGQDLHDGLCQHLAAIGFAAKSLADDLEKCERPETTAAQEIEALLKEAVIEARDLARGMFPVQMDAAGLSAALEGLAATTSRLTATKVVFTEIGEPHISDAATAMHLYRIAQESVANALKHGSARRVSITLEGVGDILRLRIDDDGQGFFGNPSTVGGMGMRTMAYRARLIGATLEIQERDGPGTCVWCEIRPQAPSPPTRTHEMSSPSQATKCKVLLVEDHPMFRERMAHLINKDLGMTVCGETDNIAAAMDIIRDSQPDIAIVDITLRGSSGLELIKDIRAQGFALPVLVLSMHAEELYAERALRAGAKGYIMKSEASSEVLEAIRTVQRGEVYVSRPMVGKILTR